MRNAKPVLILSLCLTIGSIIVQLIPIVVRIMSHTITTHFIVGITSSVVPITTCSDPFHGRTHITPVRRTVSISSLSASTTSLSATAPNVRVVVSIVSSLWNTISILIIPRNTSTTFSTSIHSII